MAAIYALSDWKRITNISVSADQVMDILASWEVSNNMALDILRDLEKARAKSEERRMALLEAFHIINEHGTPAMRAHATLMNDIRKALED